MRIIASKLTAFQHLCRREPVRTLQFRTFSAYDEREIEKEAERKVGWLLKLIFAGTATFLGYQIFPYMGDNLLQQSVTLLRVKDPLFKRMGASRLARFSIDDEAVGYLHKAGAILVIKSTPDSAEDMKVNEYKSNLMKRFRDLRYDVSS
ncbi:uncharacterized protein LOC103496719 isoform X3 [Cucumis melo]|uniref:Uncharacterized protein LOC103496719 isoform X3 n=1 Tax=Cucumis melo TaxID=3656 RepID=A0A1S3C4Y6_CUCME|nr:uncharacterized protein LOC103496719 isoform X3 [Cucumis melo]